jgi:hypothetical protein
MVFQTGNKLGGRHKGSLNQTTLLKEERRAIFDRKASEKWEEIIDKLPPTYIADQFLGKAPDILKATVQEKKAVSEKSKKLINELTNRTDE